MPKTKARVPQPARPTPVFDCRAVPPRAINAPTAVIGTASRTRLNASPGSPAASAPASSPRDREIEPAAPSAQCGSTVLMTIFGGEGERPAVARWLPALALPSGRAHAPCWARPQAERALGAPHPSHFWLVLITALVSPVLGYLAGEAARRLGDAPLPLVFFAFMTSAGFLDLQRAGHARRAAGGRKRRLRRRNAGRGSCSHAVFAAASALDLSSEHSGADEAGRGSCEGGVFALLAGWAAYSLAGLPPLDRALSATEAHGPLYTLAGLRAAVRLTSSSTGGSLRPCRLRSPSPSRCWRRRGIALPSAATRQCVLVGMARADGPAPSESSPFTTAERVSTAVTQKHAVFKDLYPRAKRPTSSTGVMRARCASSSTRSRRVRLPRAAITVDRGRNRLPATRGSGAPRAGGRRAPPPRPALQPLPLSSAAERACASPAQRSSGARNGKSALLFADLQGLAAFSERSTPPEVVAMLNAYWAQVVPAVAAEEGGSGPFAGDAVMVVFNAAADQPVAARLPEPALAFCGIFARPWRPGVRTGPGSASASTSGPAVIGNVTTAKQRSFTAMSDTTNLAARLQAAAEPGRVVVLGSATHRALSRPGVFEPLPPARPEGREKAVGSEDSFWSS